MRAAMTEQHPIMHRLAALPRLLAFAVAVGAGALGALGFEPVGSIAGPVLGLALLLLLLAARPLRWGWASASAISCWG